LFTSFSNSYGWKSFLASLSGIITTEDIIDKLDKYIKIGAKHVVLGDFSSACDINKIQSVYHCIKKVLDYFKNT